MKTQRVRLGGNMITHEISYMKGKGKLTGLELGRALGGWGGELGDQEVPKGIQG